MILTLTTMSRGNDRDLPQVPYATALELYVQMCFTFLILSMFEFVGVHYFTKHGGGDYHNIGELLRNAVLVYFNLVSYTVLHSISPFYRLCDLPAEL